MQISVQTLPVGGHCCSEKHAFVFYRKKKCLFHELSSELAHILRMCHFTFLCFKYIFVIFSASCILSNFSIGSRFDSIACTYYVTGCCVLCFLSINGHFGWTMRVECKWHLLYIEIIVITWFYVNFVDTMWKCLAATAESFRVCAHFVKLRSFDI